MMTANQTLLSVQRKQKIFFNEFSIFNKKNDLLLYCKQHWLKWFRQEYILKKDKKGATLATAEEMRSAESGFPSKGILTSFKIFSPTNEKIGSIAQRMFPVCFTIHDVKGDQVGTIGSPKDIDLKKAADSMRKKSILKKVKGLFKEGEEIFFNNGLLGNIECDFNKKSIYRHYRLALKISESELMEQPLLAAAIIISISSSNFNGGGCN